MTKMGYEGSSTIRRRSGNHPCRGATYYGTGTALARIAGAILRDEHAVLTVSSLAPEAMELGEVSLSLPTIITRDGVARVVYIPLDASERQALEASARETETVLSPIEGHPVTPSSAPRILTLPKILSL